MPYDSQPTQVKSAYQQIYRLAYDHFSNSAKACEDFLFAWYNVKAWGGWAPQDISALDRENAQALLILLGSIKVSTWYPPSDDMERLAERKRRKPRRRSA